jgi:hypothetical protein
MTRPAWHLLAFAAALTVLVPACNKKPKATDSSPDPEPRAGSSDARPTTRTDTPSKPVRAIIGGSGARVAAARTQSEANLKQIGLAMHNAHDTTLKFPAGYADPAGKKMTLSWRVAILPYIEQDNLYRMFKLDEPWDSPANKKLIQHMPKQYAAPSTEAFEGKTYYRGFTGERTILDPKPMRPGAVFGMGMVQITDGSSNTVLVVEAADPVIWTKPDELAYDPKKPVPKVGGVFETGFCALFADGQVKFLPKWLEEQTLRNLIDAADGNVVTLP